MEPDPATILIVEDDRATRTFLADNLAADGHEVLAAESETEAELLIASKFPDLAVVDLGLPDRDGLELLTRVRGADRAAGGIAPDLPMLVLSGRAGELDRLRGFRRGCDDYVTKPFSYAELYARILALLRRSQRRAGLARIRVGPLLIDSLAQQVWLHGVPVHLSNKEFGLVLALASDPTRVFTREELLRSVWGFRTVCATRTVDSHAHRLRRKLEVKGDGFVVNVWGVGYKLVNGAVEH
jgi:DNA-binding response OmpR family regulator